jgi:glycosyltransferase involved in cell wall biosynthesis
VGADLTMSSRTHVCLFPGQLQLGGVGRNTLNLAEELLRRGVRVDLFLSKRAGPYVSQIPEGARIWEGGGRVRSSVIHLVRYLRAERPQLLVSARPYINLAAVLAVRLAGTATKVVVTERTSTETELRVRGGLRERLITLGCRVVYPHADHVVAVSESVAGDLERVTRLPRERIKVIYNPVVTRRIQDLQARPVDDAWVERSTNPLVLGIGRLTVQKDFPTLIRAVAQLEDDTPVRLAILGEGEDRESLQELVKTLGIEDRVYLPGYVDNPYAWMSRANLLVLSSGWEGLPTVLIEAMATGTPVVSTDCPGGSREILADGEFGTLVPMGSVPALAEAIRETLAQPIAGSRLRERAREFSAEAAADRYLELIRPSAMVACPHHQGKRI